MATYNLVSDFHLGTKRAAHTTRESSKKLAESLFTSALSATSFDNTLCLGDLFDKATNSETTLLQGYFVAEQCDLVMSGNHDQLGREGVTTTLHALKEVTGNGVVCMAPTISTPFFDTHGDNFWVVPHHASNELFEKALVQATIDAEKNGKGHKYLLLHTNYEVPFDTEDNTLNLTEEMAVELLKTFTRIFSGHEHNPKTVHGERLVMVGNHHPSSFSDVSNKYRWRLDTETDELSKDLIWSVDKGYREVVYGEPLPDLAGVQFVDVIGSEPVDNGVEVAEFVRSVWSHGEDLLAVRNNVEIRDHLADFDGVDSTKPALVNLKQRIGDDLEGSDLQGVYRELLSIAEEQA